MPARVGIKLIFMGEKPVNPATSSTPDNQVGGGSLSQLPRCAAFLVNTYFDNPQNACETDQKKVNFIMMNLVRSQLSILLLAACIAAMATGVHARHLSQAIVVNGEGCGQVPPGPPVNLRATPGDGEVTLSWSAPANGACVDSYQVRNASALLLMMLSNPFSTIAVQYIGHVSFAGHSKACRHCPLSANQPNHQELRGDDQGAYQRTRVHLYGDRRFQRAWHQ
jgi:hypothetical protein